MLRLGKVRLKVALQEANLSLPLPFLCPSWNAGGNLPSQKREQRRYASTSYSTSLNSSQKENGTEHFLPSRKESKYASGSRSSTMNRHEIASTHVEESFSFDLPSHLPSQTISIEQGSLTENEGGGENDSNGRKKDTLQDLNMSEQDILLGQAFVRDIIRKPPDLLYSSDQLDLLKEVEDTYFQYDKDHQQILDTMMPELALAYIHIGHDSNAVTLLERTRNLYEKYVSPTTTPLHAWKSVLAAAFKRRKFILTAQLAEVGGAGMNSDDDWAMIGRLEASLLQRHSRKAKSGQEQKVNVEQYWTEFEKYGRIAPEHIFGSLLKEQIIEGDVMAIANTLKARLKHGYTIDETTWRYLPRIHPRGRRRGVLNEILTQLDVDVQMIFEDLVKFFYDRNNLRQIVLVFRMFGISTDMAIKERCWTPSLESMEVFTRLLCQNGKLEAALSILRLSLSLKIEGDYSNIYVEISRSLRFSGRTEDALAFATQMTKSPFPFPISKQMNLYLPVPILKPSRRFYGECLKVCATFSDPITAVESARRVFLNLFANEVKPNRSVRCDFAGLFRATMMNSSWKDMTLFLEKISVEAVKRSQEHEDHTLRDFVDNLHSRGAFDAVIAANRDMTLEDSRDARENLQWVIKTSDIPNTSLGISAKDVNEETSSISAQQPADRLLEEEGLSADPYVHLTPRLKSKAYALRLRVFAVIRQDYGSAVVIYRYMLSQGIKPTSHHIAPIIEGLVMNGRLEDAHAIRDGARKSISDIDSSNRISTAIIRGQLQRNNWSGVREELEAMRQRHIHPDSFILSMVQMAQKHRIWEANQNKKESIHIDVKNVQRTMKTFFNPVRKAFEAEITKRYTHRSITKDDTFLTIQMNPFNRSNLTIQKVTTVYQYLASNTRHLLAVQYLSNALEAGIKADKVLNIVIHNHVKRIKREIRREGFEWEMFLNSKGPDYCVEIEPVLPKNNSTPAIGEAKMKTNERIERAKVWAPIIQLCLDNRAKARKYNPARLKREERAKQAREDLLRLILDIYGGGNTLRDEAMTKLKELDDTTTSE